MQESEEGLALTVTGRHGPSQGVTGMILGTPIFAAPEQVAGNQITTPSPRIVVPVGLIIVGLGERGPFYIS